MLEQAVTKEAVIFSSTTCRRMGWSRSPASSTSCVSKPKTSPVPREHAVGEHPAFGMGADRPEAQDPVQFTEHLRRAIETRQDG